MLDHVNLKFRIGEKLAIVGENGSGKSTFIKLLCRLYDPTEGEILLNGINIKKYKYKEYMSVFSVVFQDFKLFALPLGQNVAASTEYDADKVQECLKLAGFDVHSDRMKKGLDTWLYKDCDADGVNISGGEEQKIALARALYQNAAFLILDEPTAALDPIAEAEVYSSFNEIVGDRTAVYISHRLSSCRFCDEIVVFDQGRIVQQGTHEELVEQTNCKYYELWSAQAKYYA
ncbi:MAG: ABC transporter ATP-binding protein [Roseburia sp.]|uniref:ABC transporter ATP-binding protein n=1 Tax=Roseburia inulinivorans TaxID=360807 RepID=A0A3R6G710_9FIRM|nr:ABC transporter ATP-binding protein [Roseburia sp.]MBS7144103.1 ABC transporter ATP-binding protein [Roseburia sp.]RHE98919.1 ABC transporter ATP-binding protein [Roseburia inulinivorans]